MPIHRIHVPLWDGTPSFGLFRALVRSQGSVYGLGLGMNRKAAGFGAAGTVLVRLAPSRPKRPRKGLGSTSPGRVRPGHPDRRRQAKPSSDQGLRRARFGKHGPMPIMWMVVKNYGPFLDP